MDANRGNDSRGPALYHLQIPHTASAPLRRMLASRFPKESICPVWHSLELLKIPRERFSQFDFFSGHLQFGYHLPAMLGRPVQVVTMLRDPRAMLFSRYKQVSQDPVDPMRDHMDEHCPTIEAFFSSGQSHMTERGSSLRRRT